MASRKILTVIFTVFVIVAHVTLVLGEDVPEFQYPCYVDICTFPRQFCNSDKYERRCSPCSASLCRDERVPLACKYLCNKLLNPLQSTTTKPTGIDRRPNDETDQESSSIYLIVAYNAVVTTLFVVTLMIGVACHIQKKRSKAERLGVSIRQTSYSSYPGRPDEAIPLQADMAAVRLSRLQEVVCPDCRVVRIEEITPPSYRSNNLPDDDELTEASRQNAQNNSDQNPLVTQPVDTDDTECVVTSPCRPEMTEIETQTTPKSAEHLSFDFSSTSKKII